MMVMPATKYLWARTTSIFAVMIEVNGLCYAVDLLLHPSILSTGKVQAMFRQLLDVYSQTNGKADPDHIADVFVIRVQQHIEAVIEYAVDPENTIPDLRFWKDREKVAFIRLKDQARSDCDLSMYGCRRAKGETGEEFLLSRMEGVDADMKINQYRRGEDGMVQQLGTKSAGMRKRSDEANHPTFHRSAQGWRYRKLAERRNGTDCSAGSVETLQKFSMPRIGAFT